MTKVKKRFSPNI